MYKSPSPCEAVCLSVLLYTETINPMLDSRHLHEVLYREVSKDRRHYKPYRATPLRRYEQIREAARNLQVPHNAINWTELDDWTDAQRDIKAHVEGPTAYYQTSNPSYQDIRAKYEDRDPIPVPKKIIALDAKTVAERDMFREAYAQAAQMRRKAIQRRKDREARAKPGRPGRPGRPARYLHPKRRPGRPTGYSVPDPELEEMAEMFAKRREDAIKSREKAKRNREQAKRNRKKKVEKVDVKAWLKQRREDRRNRA